MLGPLALRTHDQVRVFLRATIVKLTHADDVQGLVSCRQKQGRQLLENSHHPPASPVGAAGAYPTIPVAPTGNAVKHFFSGKLGLPRLRKCEKSQTPRVLQLNRSVRKESGYVSQEATESKPQAAAT